MPNDIITITEATEKKAGPSMKCSYTDATGKKWHSWKDTLQLHAGETYELLEIETKKWSPKDHPDREYTDYVIKKAKKIAAPVTSAAVQTAAAIQAAGAQAAAGQATAQPAGTNGYAPTRHKWDAEEVLSARLSLIIGGWAQSGQISVDDESVARALIALERGAKLYKLGMAPQQQQAYQPVESENPGDDMDGTPFGR